MHIMTCIWKNMLKKEKIWDCKGEIKLFMLKSNVYDLI